jgi:hypothetical protein
MAVIIVRIHPQHDRRAARPPAALCGSTLPDATGMLAAVAPVLPTGYTWRRPGVDDAEAIWEFVAGYAWACRKGDSNEIDVDTLAEVEAVGDWLWAATVARAGEIGAELGHAKVALDVGIYRVDVTQRVRAKADGFTIGTTFHRLRIDHHGAPAEPDASAVTIRTGEKSGQVRRDALAVVNAATAGQFGYVERTFEDWHRDMQRPVRRG